LAAPNASPRINERIRITPVKVIGAAGEMLGEMATADALKIARESGLDLVEVASNVRPPVCRVMDYGKARYQKQKRSSGAHQHRSQLKQLRLRAKTGQHDIDTKLARARTFLSRGDKVKLNVVFRGRENAHRDRGREMLEQFVGALADVAAVEQTPRMDSGRQMSAIVKPRPGPVRAAAGRTVAVGDVTPAAD
jgi:translation initiation factor IF-3